MTSSLLSIIWKEQEVYNEITKKLEANSKAEHWTEIYLLGMISEVDELLSMINWKRNRKHPYTPIDRASLAMELADLTKFIFSLWQLWEFTEHEMLSTVAAKNEMLDFMLRQEMSPTPTNVNVVMCDIDGVLADWRTSFIEFLMVEHGEEIAGDAAEDLHIDTDLNLRYSEYQKYKDQFERDGGYSRVRPYLREIYTLQYLQEERNFHIVLVTARPYRVYKRIWLDTWEWLRKQGIKPDELHFVEYDRIVMTRELQEQNCNVVMFEDDPKIIRRAANDNIKIMCKAQPYNKEVKSGTNISRVEEITVEEIRKFIYKHGQFDKTR
jgi:uncharacterized HAD superfamily protein/NTP pyrophosphatase (non-canonical NTP hydrolase)